MYICYLDSSIGFTQLRFKDLENIYNWISLNKEELLINIDSIVINGVSITFNELEKFSTINSGLDKYPELEEGVSYE
jgi:hypothetical protein